MIHKMDRFFSREEKWLKQYLRHVDLVLEILDARLPATSRNHTFIKLLRDKKRVVILNKADLAEKDITGHWLQLMAVEEGPVLPFSAKVKKDLHELERTIMSYRPAGIKFRRPLRLIVVGIPNVGKSSIVNRLLHRMAAKTGARPGITKGPQWIRLRAGWEILDTPGVLQPVIKDSDSRAALAAIGSLETREVDGETTAKWVMEKYLQREKTARTLLSLYSLQHTNRGLDEIFDLIGEKRGCYLKGGLVDREKVAALILRDFRKGTLGRISLEMPEGYGQVT